MQVLCTVLQKGTYNYEVMREINSSSIWVAFVANFCVIRPHHTLEPFLRASRSVFQGLFQHQRWHRASSKHMSCTLSLPALQFAINKASHPTEGSAALVFALICAWLQLTPQSR